MPTPFRSALLTALVAAVLPAVAVADPLPLPPPRAGYPAIRTWHEQALAVGPTAAERLDHLRTVARAGPYGQRGLDRVFKNFEGPMSLDPAIPGVERTVRLTASDSPAQRKGAARTLLYAAGVHNDARFQLIAVNRPVLDRITGRVITDEDIVWRHAATGRVGRMEVKDATPASQRANLVGYARQLDKMAADAGRAGIDQGWVSRHPVVPELRAHAARLGIPVYESVTAGRRPRTGEVRFGQVLDDMDRRSLRATAGAAAGGGGLRGAAGALILARGAEEAWAAMTGASQDDRDALLWRWAASGSQVVAGGSLVVGGGADVLAAMSRTTTMATRLQGVSRWGGRLGVAAAVGAEAVLVGQYLSGYATDRQFYTGQAQLVSGAAFGLAGGYLGAKLGAAVGVYFGGLGAIPGAIGGFALGLAAGYLGSWLGERAVTYAFELSDARQDAAYREFLQEWYARPGGPTGR